MLLTIFDFVGWGIVVQQFLWTFGLGCAIIFIPTFIAWRREDTEGFEPWEFTWLITTPLGLIITLFSALLAPDRRWLRVGAWIVVGGLLVIVLDYLLPSLFGVLATLGLVAGAKHLFNTDRHGQDPPSS